MRVPIEPLAELLVRDSHAVGPSTHLYAFQDAEVPNLLEGNPIVEKLGFLSVVGLYAADEVQLRLALQLAGQLVDFEAESGPDELLHFTGAAAGGCHGFLLF